MTHYNSNVIDLILQSGVGLRTGNLDRIYFDKEEVMQLTAEQTKQLDEVGSVFLVVDGRECVLMRSDVFEAQGHSLLEDWHPETMQRQMADMLAEDWCDPAPRWRFDR